MTTLTQEQARGERESDIARAVIQHWRALGVPGSLVAAIPNAYSHGQAGLTRGLPDLIVMAPGLPVGFIELKTKSGRIRPEQADFKARCLSLGIAHSITRGRDEPIEILETWNVVRRSK
jgi:hypothetical protein